MATATLYTLSKRHNSTLQPSGSGTDITVALKGGSDILTPVFTLNYTGIPTFNYMAFGGRYYFVTGIKNVREDLWEVSAAVDVLATYKTDIQSISAYVLFYTHTNTEISDKRLSIETTKTIDSAEGVFDTLGNGTGTDYAVVLNTIGDHSCDAYVTDQATAREILDDLENWFDNDDYSQGGSGIQTDLDDPVFSWATVEEAIKSFLQETLFFWKQWFATGKVSDNLRSAYMLPLPPSAIGGYTRHIMLGQYDTGIDATRVYDRIFSDGCTVSIPWQASDWRRNAPYHELYLYIPYIGVINLSPSDFINDTEINVSVSIDVTSGDAVFSVYTGTNRYIGQYCTNVGASFAIGTSNVQMAQSVNTLVGATVAGAAALASGGTAAIAAAFTGGTLSLANDISGNPTCIGANMGGAVLGLTDKVICYTVFHDTTVSPGSVSAVKGTPYNGVISLSGISGYVQTAAASVAGNMTDTEREEINTLLDGGIYIE